MNSSDTGKICGEAFPQSGSSYQGKLPSSQTNNEVSGAYEEYLSLLQCRNKLLRKLKKKSKRQIKLERKELGFSLYLNGANIDNIKEKFSSCPKNYCSKDDDVDADNNSSENKNCRKKWLLNEKSRESAARNIDYQRSFVDNDASGLPKQPSFYSDSTHDDEIPEQLRLSFMDLKELRRKLESNTEIQKSLTEEISDKENNQGTCSEDEVAEIPDEISSESSSSQSKETRQTEYKSSRRKWKESRRSSSNFFPDDVIVLELAPSITSPSRQSRTNGKSSALKDAISPQNEQFSEMIDMIHKRENLLGFESSKNVMESEHHFNSSITNELSQNCVLPEFANSVLSNVIHRIVGMAPRQQRNLLKALEVLEESAEGSLMAAQVNPPSTCSSGSSTNAPIHHPQGESAKYINSGSESSHYKNNIIGDSSSGNEESSFNPGFSNLSNFHTPSKGQKLRNETDSESSELNTKCEVLIRIFSNWGHSARVGLTEVQFLDGNKDCLTIHPITDISSCGVFNEKGLLTNLVNGRTKTVKEKYMWSCSIPTRGYIELTFCLKPSSSPAQIGSILIWNYNRSIKELDIGVKSIQVIVDGVAAFEGDLDRGCGNQVFDYGQIIKIDTIAASKGQELVKSNTFSSFPSSQGVKARSSSHSVKTRPNTNESVHKTPSLPDSIERQNFPKYDLGRNHNSEFNSDTSVEKTFSPFKGTKSPKKTISRNQSAKSSVESLDLSYDLRNSDHDLKSESFDWLEKRDATTRTSLHSQQTSNIQGWFPSIDLRSSGDFKSENIRRVDDTTPNWYASLKQPTSNLNAKKPMWLKNVNIKENEPFMNPPENKPAVYVAPERNQSSTHGGDYEIGAIPISAVTKKEFNVNEQARETSAKFGRRSKACSALSVSSVNSDRSDVGGKRRSSEASALWGRNTALEDCWSSLHAFDQCHKGQIMDFADDDILDAYQRPPIETDNCSLTSINDVAKVEDFIIPELPAGQHLTLNILSTWGDKHYIGLNGIEIFCENGKQVKVEKIWANPSDINILSEYSNDPRVTSNLIDGVNCTRDDMHMWLAPFTPSQPHYVQLLFNKPVKVAMIRIWNYNKSRIHSLRGAKDIDIKLDNMMIFKGEIAKASGDMQGNLESFGDTILFTTEESILEAISVNDNSFLDCMADTLYPNEIDSIIRPLTGDSCAKESRPFTAAGNQTPTQLKPNNEDFYAAVLTDVLELQVASSWGDYDSIGLSGLEIIDVDGNPIPLNSRMISISNPVDPNSEVFIYRLIDDTYITMFEDHMWTTSFAPDQECSIFIKFSSAIKISGIRLWNYNGNIESTYRGVKQLIVKASDTILSPPGGFLIRRAPGNCFFDFAQELCFFDPTSLNNPFLSGSNQICLKESSVLPQGFVFQIQLLSTWEDHYYIGLNGIEIFDESGKLVPLEENNISAYPSSVNVLDNVFDDVRTPDKLIDGTNESSDSQHSWLAPVLPGIVNRIFIIFDYPVSISMIKLWNYSKTSNRGVKEFGILVDDLLVFNGILKKYSENGPCYNTIMFSDNDELILKERLSIIRNEEDEQDIQMTNNSVVVKSSSTVKTINQALRPQTGVRRPSVSTNKTVR